MRLIDEFESADEQNVGTFNKIFKFTPIFSVPDYTPVEIQLQRTYRDKNRPLIQVENPEQKLTDLLCVRDPLYREVAHYIIETNQGAARDLAQRILNLILVK